MVCHYHEPAKFIVETDIQNLQDRLEKDQILDGRIVLCMENNLYLLRILGQNLIMKSRLNFNRFENVKVKVKKLTPKLELVLLCNNNSTALIQDNGTDIII